MEASEIYRYFNLIVAVQQDFFYSFLKVLVLANFILKPKNSLGMQGLERRPFSVFPCNANFTSTAWSLILQVNSGNSCNKIT
jgi:hypothetical protein